MAAAGHLGDLATARAGLLDHDPGVRTRALGALLRLGALDVALVERALEDGDWTVRRRAAELSWRVVESSEALEGEEPVLGRGVEEELGEVLAARLADESAEVVEAACYALGELRYAGATSSLTEIALRHGDPLCRESAVAALGSIAAPGSLGAILAALDDRPAVRRRAVIALASYEGPQVDAALLRALQDRDWQVRQAAEDRLGKRSLSGRRARPSPSGQLER